MYSMRNFEIILLSYLKNYVTLFYGENLPNQFLVITILPIFLALYRIIFYLIVNNITFIPIFFTMLTEFQNPYLTSFFKHYFFNY